LLIKRGNFYTHANYQKRKSTIFLVFYLFHGIYTKIFMIFGSAHDFLFKFKHQAFLNKKEKGKHTVLRWWPAWTRPKTARKLPASRAGIALLTRPLTGGSRPSDSPSTSRRGSGELKLIAGELPASAVGWASTFGLSRNPWDTRDSLYSPLTLLLASTADDGTNRASTCRHKWLEREPTSA
jgi:hypothetical protein